MLGELSTGEIEKLLGEEITGRIGCHAEGRTYVVPVTYAYESGCVYGHSFKGMKIQFMRKNPLVCFEVDRIHDLGNWQSVIGWGRFEELDGPQALAAMDLLVRRLAALSPEKERHPSYVLRAWRPDSRTPDGSSVILYRIQLTEKSGRFERS